MSDELKKMVVLVDPAVHDQDYAAVGSTYPTNALMLLGTMLLNEGYRVEIIDGNYHKDYIDRLAECVKQNVDSILYVGISVMTVAVPGALRASEAVKSISTDLQVVWGGPHPTLFSDQVLRSPYVDIIAINEGTKAALAIAHALESESSLADIKGIGYKINTELEDGSSKLDFIYTGDGPPDVMEELPYFDFSLIDADKYLYPSVSVYQREFPGFGEEIVPAPILTGLGCPYKCEFCINVILERKYRYKSAKSIVREIKRLQADLGVNTIIFMDEEFFISKRRFLELLDLIEEEGLKFNWRMWGRVDRFKDSYLNAETLERLHSLGCGSLVMGGESGNEEVLSMLNKRTTTKQVINSLRSLAGFPNIVPRYSFIVGMENETIEQIRDTYNFTLKMKKIRPDVDIAGPFAFRLYPGSPIYKRLVSKYDISIPDELAEWEQFLNTQDVTYSDMPWAPDEFCLNVKRIQFYQLLALSNFASRTVVHKIIISILSALARFRIRHFFFRVPIEYWAYGILKSARG